MGETSPEEDAAREDLDVSQNSGTGGCKAGDCFEKGIREVGDGSAEDKGETAHQRYDDPSEGNGQKTFSGVEYFFVGFDQQDGQSSDDRGNQYRIEKGEDAFLVDQRYDHGENHQGTNHQENPSHNANHLCIIQD